MSVRNEVPVMRKLTGPEVEELASRSGVRRIAVENFLTTFPLDLNPMYQNMNLIADARAYGWNQETIQAIRDGLQKARLA